MEYIIILISVITIIFLKIGLNIKIKNLKEIKEIGNDKRLNEIGNKFPDNKEICTKILKKLNNNEVKIEENESKTSLYIAITNKIIIANIKDTFTRIQTIAHECLHSIQNRKILIFNFIFSNIYLFYFIIALILILFNFGNSSIYIGIYIGFSFIYFGVRTYLETEAMSKAIYISKEYMEEYKTESENVANEEIQILLQNFDKLNKIGIPLTNFSFAFGITIKLILLSIISIIF